MGLMLFVSAFVSCSDDDTPDEPKGAFEDGYFITNEGPFQNGTGTITFVGDDGTVVQNAYRGVNGEDLGNIVNSMHLDDEQAYIVVNNSNRIVIADRFSLERTTVIEGGEVMNPRHFRTTGGKGYFSQWGDPFDPTDDKVQIVDLSTMSLSGSVGVGEGPERMLLDGDRLYVCLKGGFGQNNALSVIDTGSDQLIQNIQVGDVPGSLAKDDAGNLWVLCEGKPAFTGDETIGRLAKVNTQDFSVQFFDFVLGEHPAQLSFDSGNLYYNLNGMVYEMDPSASSLPSSPLNGLGGFYYYMTVSNGELYGTDAKDFASEGELKVFNVRSGSLVESIPAGIIPGYIAFP